MTHTGAGDDKFIKATQAPIRIRTEFSDLHTYAYTVWHSIRARANNRIYGIPGIITRSHALACVCMCHLDWPGPSNTTPRPRARSIARHIT